MWPSAPAAHNARFRQPDRERDPVLDAPRSPRRARAWSRSRAARRGAERDGDHAALVSPNISFGVFTGAFAGRAGSRKVQ